MKWIGQHIWDFISRFRNDIYLEDISTGTIASGGNLGLDTNNKIVKAAEAIGDITRVTITTDSGADNKAEDTSGSADFSILGSSGVDVTNSTSTITVTSVPGEIDHDSLLNFTANKHYTQESITTVGSITTGVWRGDAINGSYIASNAIDSEHYVNASIDTAHIADDQVTFAKASGVTPSVYGSIIKLLPSDFAANDDGGNNKFGIGYVDHAGVTYGMRPADAATELFAFISIPEGMKATHVDIYDKNDLAVAVFECQINGTTMTSKGTGNCNTQIDITDVNATATNFLSIQVTTTATNDRIFGGQVTIEAI